MMKLAPIALFTYARPEHTRRTVEALSKNLQADDSDLYIFSDGARSQASLDRVQSVREYIRTIDDFKSVTIIERERNFGLAGSIVNGVTRLSNQYGKVIVLEDDMLTSPYFLSYMNEALDLYEMDERVISIHGYVYPVAQSLPEAFFMQGADCWGWATWQRGWAHFNPDGQYLLGELNRRKLVSSFDFNGAYSFSEMLAGQIKGLNDSWAVRWHASAFLADKLTLYPGRSLVHNIGSDNSGTHCGDSDLYDTVLSQTPIDLSCIEVKSFAEGRHAFERFFRKSKEEMWKRLMRRLAKSLWFGPR
jgi:hypothetical protein